MRNDPLSERCKTTYRLAGLLFRFPTQHSLIQETHGGLPSVGVLGLPCLDLRILSGLLRCPVQLALLDALELLHLVLPVQVVQVLPSLDLSDLQTHAAAGQSAAQQRTERAFVCGPLRLCVRVALCERWRTFFLLMHSCESLVVGVTFFPSQSVTST